MNGLICRNTIPISDENQITYTGAITYFKMFKIPKFPLFAPNAKTVNSVWPKE